MDYTFSVNELIEELEHWADSRDRINKRPERKPLDSTALREAAGRLHDAYDDEHTHIGSLEEANDRQNIIDGCLVCRGIEAELQRRAESQ